MPYCSFRAPVFRPGQLYVPVFSPMGPKRDAGCCDTTLSKIKSFNSIDSASPSPNSAKASLKYRKIAAVQKWY